MSLAATIHALVPLSLLEAIRNLDTPIDDGLSEVAGETVSKRLGLSATVAQRIDRYREQAEDGEPVSLDEAVSVFRLVGRRPDATLVYSDAGRRAARHGTRIGSTGSRLLLTMSPEPLRRRLGSRTVSKLARKALDVSLILAAGRTEARMPESLATRAGFAGTGCHFYSAALAELLRLTFGFEGAMVHERCRARGDDHCFWRAAESGGYE
ncbi:MAG: hypothetical protein ACRENB_07555 [Gemmatimonadales bacterium]